MAKDTRREADEPQREEDIVVRLKPVFGVAPGVYLTALYILVGLAVLFFLFLFPGLRRPGSVVEFTSVPTGAAVIVDGQRLGATPLSAFVDGGRREIVIDLPHYSEARQSLDVPRQVVGTALFPARSRVDVSLSLESVDTLLRDAVTDFSGWAFLRRATLDAQFPLVLSDSLEHLVASGDLPSASRIRQLLDFAAAHSAGDSVARDLLRAGALALSGGPLNPRGLAGGLQQIIHLYADSENFALWLRDNLGESGADALGRTSWYTTSLASSSESRAALTPTADSDPPVAGDSPPGGTLVFDDMRFVAVPGARLLVGEEDFQTGSGRPFVADVAGFWMMDRELTRAQFDRFLQAAPELRPDEQEGGLDGDLPLSGVSLPTAWAFTEWMNAEFTQRPRGFEFRLPREEEYEAALYALGWRPGGDRPSLGRTILSVDAPVAVSTGPEDAAIQDLVGNLWEWTSSWFTHTRGLVAGGLPVRFDDSALRGAYVVVRGGSFANADAPERYAEARGAQDPSWASPYLGFRPVLAPVDGGL